MSRQKHMSSSTSQKPIGLVMVNTITRIRTVSLSHYALILAVMNLTLNRECKAKYLTVSIYSQV